MSEKKYVGVNMWKKESGSYMSHGSGLTDEQIEMLKSVKPGDRLIVSPNVSKIRNAGSYDYYLRLYRKEYVKQEGPGGSDEI